MENVRQKAQSLPVFPVAVVLAAALLGLILFLPLPL